MPWHIEGKSVVNSETGEVMGHSKNPKRYLRALYANVPEARRHGKKKGRYQSYRDKMNEGPNR